MGQNQLPTPIKLPIFGEARNGAKRWIFGIQPSEFIKISYILYGAKLMSKLDKEENNAFLPLLKKFAPNFFLLWLLPVFIIPQSDLGTILHYIAIFMSMILLSKFRGKDIFIVFISFSTAFRI